MFEARIFPRVSSPRCCSVGSKAGGTILLSPCSRGSIIPHLSHLFLVPPRTGTGVRDWAVCGIEESTEPHAQSLIFPLDVFTPTSGGSAKVDLIVRHPPAPPPCHPAATLTATPTGSSTATTTVTVSGSPSGTATDTDTPTPSGTATGLSHPPPLPAGCRLPAGPGLW